MARPVERIPNLIATDHGPVSLEDVNLVFENHTRENPHLAHTLYESFLRSEGRVRALEVAARQLLEESPERAWG